MSELARFLKPRLETLTARWVERVGVELAPEGVPQPVVRDHIGGVLQALLEALDGGVVPDTIASAKDHGKQRYSVGFGLISLVREYGLLRSLITDLAAEAELTNPIGELRVVADFMSVAVADGVAEYDEKRLEEQRQREQSMTEARLLSDSALTAGSVGTFTWDILTDRLHGDASFALLFGIRLDASGAAPLSDYLAAIHPYDREATTAKIQRTVEEGGAYEAEYRIITGGRVRWVVARGRVDCDDDGRPVRFPGVLMDVTERKLAEDAERALKARLSMALTTGDLGSFDWDLQSDVLQLDARAREIFGFAPDDPVDGAALLTRIDPRDRARLESATQTAIASQPRMSAEYRLAIADRPELVVLTFGELVRGPDGRAERMTGFFRDMTVERQAAEARRQTEERVRRIVDASGAGLWDLEIGTGLIESDARMVELMGLPVGSSFSLASGLDGLPMAEDRQRVTEAINDAVAGKNGGHYQVEFRTGARSSPRWVESRARVTFDEAGTATQLSGAMIDITARKRAEAERELAQSQVTELLESMNEAVISVTADWEITRVNRRYEQLAHRSRDEVIGKDLWSLFPDDTRATAQYWAQYQRTMTERMPSEFVEYYAPLGLWTDVHAYPTSDGGMTAFIRDISAQRRAETALQASEERYRTLFNAIDEGFCLVEISGGHSGQPIDCRFLEINRAFASQTGLENAMGKSMRELLPENEEYWFETYARVAESGEPLRFEAEAKALGRFFDVYATPIGLRDARQVAIVFKEITARRSAERERAELLAREQAARMEAENARKEQHDLFMLAPVAICILEGPEHRYTFANPTYRAIVDNRDVVGMSLYEALPELREMGFDKLLDRVKETGEIFVAKEMPIRLQHHRNDELVYLDFAYTPKRNVAGEIDGVMTTALDITTQVIARQRVEALVEELRISEVRYRTLFESTDEGVCLIEVLYDEHRKPVDYRYLQVNAAFASQTGLTDVVGKTMREIVPNIEPFWPELYGRVVATGESARVENPVREMRRWFDVHASRVGAAELNQVVVLFSDVTERKTIEVERERLLALETKAREMAEEASHLKDQFLATVSHELRTPLTAILGWVQMLRSGTLSTDRHPRALETIERNARSQARLIEDLLDMSRILSGKLSLEIQRLDLSLIVEAAVESIRPAAEAKGIRIQPALESSGVVMGDPNRLQQVAWNLLTNAVKFTPKGGRIQVLLRSVDSSAELTVSDTGQGIAPEFLPYVFERFRQAEGGSSRAKGGLGLGLSIVKQLVEMHGGTISVISEGLGHGTTFAVRLPFSVLRRNEVEPAREASTSSHRELEGLRLLVVDDEDDTREMLAAMLEGSGAHVTQASSAADGRRSFAADRPDVIVSDIGMPHENGYSFIGSIRRMAARDGSNVPAVALTAYARSEDRTKALIAGFSSHVAKPVEPAELIAAIASLARHAR